ncbi:MAG TPA: hypothetical protein VND91_11005 [Candidatus Saccharimonadia bacterium]|nr:hypothetical protein [Candidatus Saccharimonadia bacterium]
MHVVQLFLPLNANDGSPFDRKRLAAVRAELAGKYGGVTAYTRAPAQGLWEDDDGSCAHDDVVLFEVMVERIDHGWWRQYRLELQQRFGQDEILVRAIAIDRL